MKTEKVLLGLALGWLGSGALLNLLLHRRLPLGFKGWWDGPLVLIQDRQRQEQLEEE